MRNVYNMRVMVIIIGY